MKNKSYDSFVSWKEEKNQLNINEKKDRLIEIFNNIGIEINIEKNNDINDPNFSARVNSKHY